MEQELTEPTAATYIPFNDSARRELNSFDFSSDAIFDFEAIESHIDKQKVDMVALNMGEELAVAAQQLQRFQFVTCTMGLRAELMFGDGWLHWIQLSAITEYLSLCKRPVRWFDRNECIQPVSCSISVQEERQRPDVKLDLLGVPEVAKDAIERGIRLECVDYTLERLHPSLDWTNLPEANLSGYAAAWFEEQSSAYTTEE